MHPDQRPPFPTYLLPSFSFPFRRRQSSTTSELTEHSIPSLSSSPNSSAATTPGSSPPTPTFLPVAPISKTLKGLLHAALQNEAKSINPQPQKERLSTVQPNILKCASCSTDIAFASQVVSKGFTGRHGRAYLVAPPPRVPLSPSPRKKNSASKELVNTKIGKSVNRELLTGAHVVADVSCLICGTVLGWKYEDAKEPGQRYKIGKFILETKRVVMGVCWEDTFPEGEVEAPQAKDESPNGVVVFDSEDEDECEDLFAGVWDPELVTKRRARRINTRKREEVNV